MSNSAVRKGGATLFFLTVTRCPVAHVFVALLDGFDAAHIQANAGVEFEGHAAGGGLRVAKHYTDLLAQLVGEDQARVAPLDGAGQLAQRLAHEPGLQTHMAVAHLALDFGAGHQSGHAVDDHHIHRVGAHQGFGDLQCLFAGVRLAHIEAVHVDADLGCIGRIQGVLDVHEAADAALALGFGDRVETEGRLARAFRAIDLHDPPLGVATDAQRHVQAQAAAGDRLHLQLGGLAQFHDDAFAVLLVQIGQRCLQRFAPPHLARRRYDFRLTLWCSHDSSPLS